MTKLKGLLKRELMIGKVAYAVTLSSDSLKLVLKGRRKGLEIKWLDLVNGDAVMAVALRASLDMPKPAAKKAGKSMKAAKARPTLKLV
jgi:hypothetical protein